MTHGRILSLGIAASLVGCSSPTGTPNDGARAATGTDAADGGEPSWTTSRAERGTSSGEVREARSREYERLEYEPVTLNGFTSGDNSYVELTRGREGAAPETVLCTAALCADWWGAGGLPTALRDQRVAAKFGIADQVDGSGKVMARGVRAVVDLRLPAAVGQRASSGPSSGGLGELPLTPGVYVVEGDDCRNPANASWRVWNGRGLSGSATKDCRATVLSQDGESHTIRNSCANTYDGSRTPEMLTVQVPDQVHFTINGNRFRSCSMAQVPDSLRELVR